MVKTGTEIFEYAVDPPSPPLLLLERKTGFLQPMAVRKTAAFETAVAHAVALVARLVLVKTAVIETLMLDRA